MDMFDEVIESRLEADGKIEEKRFVADDVLLTEMEFQEACEEFVKAERKFARLDARDKRGWAHPDSDPKDLCDWFDALDDRYKAENRLWMLFVGKDRSIRSNLMYLEFRRVLLAGARTRADA